jgi:pyruvate,water dikinase
VRHPLGVLSDLEVLAVADLGRRIEHHLGGPQEIDWVYDPSGRLWTLQARATRLAGAGTGAG